VGPTSSRTDAAVPIQYSVTPVRRILGAASPVRVNRDRFGRDPLSTDVRFLSDTDRKNSALDLSRCAKSRSTRAGDLGHKSTVSKYC
jgi:hypothetical protein